MLIAICAIWHLTLPSCGPYTAVTIQQPLGVVSHGDHGRTYGTHLGLRPLRTGLCRFKWGILGVHVAYLDPCNDKNPSILCSMVGTVHVGLKLDQGCTSGGIARGAGKRYCSLWWFFLGDHISYTYAEIFWREQSGPFLGPLDQPTFNFHQLLNCCH